MPRPIRLILIGLVIILLLGGLIFLGLRFLGGGRTTLTVWTIPGYENALKEVGAIFATSHRNVRVNIVTVPQDEYETKALFALASKKQSGKYPAPDIWVMPNEWMELHRNKLVPAPDNSIDNAISVYKKARQKGEATPEFPATGRTNTQIIEQDYGSIVMSDSVDNSQAWGVPLSMDTLALYYDRTKVASPPKTWGDVANLAKRSERSGSTVNRSMVALGDNRTITHFADILSILMLQSGATMVREDSKTAEFNINKTGGTAPGVQALDFYTSFARPDRETYSWNATLGQSLEALRSGRTAMAFGYRNDADRFAQMNNRIAVSELPQINPNEPKSYGRYLMATVTKQVNLDAKNNKLGPAWDLVALLANPDVAEQVAKTLNQPPARIDVAKRISIGDELKPFVDQVNQAINWPKQEVAIADATLIEAVELVKTGQSPSNAADVAAKKYTEFLQIDPGIVNDPGVLNVWQVEGDSTTDYSQLFAGYKADPITRVAVSKRSPSRFEFEALNAMAAHIGPDILMVPNTKMKRFSEVLYNLPNGIAGTPARGESLRQTVARNFVPAVLEDGFIDNQLYGLPVSVETLVIAFNEKLFQKEVNEYQFKTDQTVEAFPFLWSHHQTLAKQLTKRSGQTIDQGYLAVGTGSNVPNSDDIYAAVVKQFGGQITDPDNNVTGIQLPRSSSNTSVPGREAETLLKGFANSNNDSYTWNSSMPNAIDALANGKVIAAILYPHDLPKVREKNPFISISTFTFPQLDPAQTAIDLASYPLMSISLTSPKAEQALDFLSTQINAVLNGEYVDITTAKKNSLTTETIDRSFNGPNAQNAQQNTAHSYYRSSFPDQFSQTLVQFMDSKLNLDQAASQINQLLRKPIIE